MFSLLVGIIVCGSDGRFVWRGSVAEEHVDYSPPARLSGDQTEQDRLPPTAISEACYYVLPRASIVGICLHLPLLVPCRWLESRPTTSIRLLVLHRLNNQQWCFRYTLSPTIRYRHSSFPKNISNACFLRASSLAQHFGSVFSRARTPAHPRTGRSRSTGNCRAKSCHPSSWRTRGKQGECSWRFVVFHLNLFEPSDPLMTKKKERQPFEAGGDAATRTPPAQFCVLTFFSSAAKFTVTPGCSIVTYTFYFAGVRGQKLRYTCANNLEPN